MPVDGDVRRNGSILQRLHEGFDVIGLVGAQRNSSPSSSATAIDQGKGFVALGGAGGLAHPAKNRQAMAVLHQGMAYVAELGRLTVALLVQLGLGVGRALVRLVRALLLVEAAFRIASGSLLIVVAAILLAEALERCPSLDQRAVHREVLARQKLLYPRLGQDCVQELRGDLTFQKPLPVLGEG